MGRLKIRGLKKRSFRKLFSTVIIAFAIVAFWRGIWGLLDIYLFPNSLELSLWISIVMGLVILFLTKHLIDELI